jgi:hypothetical protein
LLAHVSRYADSIAAYELVHHDMERERDLFAAAAKDIRGPAEYLFEAMERSAIRRGRRASPGPGTLFRDAWTPAVDQAYRIDRGGEEARGSVTEMMSEIDGLAALIAREDAFVVLDVRRANLERLLREIHHWLGHAGGQADGIRARHASTNGAGVEVLDDHQEDMSRLAAVMSELQRLERSVESEIKALSRIERERRKTALTLLRELRVELTSIMGDIHALEGDAESTNNIVAREAIRAIELAFEAAAMRAEAGVLDTYWLKKEHRTQEIEQLLDRKKESEDQAREAIDEAEQELSEPEPDPVPGAAE